MSNIGSFELILVNDKSPDKRTWEGIEKLAHKYDFVRGIDLLYNVGQFRATLCGLEHARGLFVITMDDDLQNPPEEIPKLVEAMRESPTMDCIMGKYPRKQHSTLRNAGSRFLDKIMNHLYGKPPHITTSSFRIMPANFARTLTLYRMASPLLAPVIVSLSKKIANVPVRHEERKLRRKRLQLHKMCENNSSKPYQCFCRTLACFFLSLVLLLQELPFFLFYTIFPVGSSEVSEFRAIPRSF